MYFKKLELLGFKSFAEKTTLNFEPGITAVVGPNGCGKSNVFDSIRWVLGEQSVKSLRGSKMEDVIFNGTENIPALGYAEVSLTFSNETKVLAVDYDEVTITRRLFRSGESEYLLNKTQVRLKDILELLMGTGIGAESYSLIEQGKIDLILSSRPEDRRFVFDEAAGISKYKSQKRETIRKLEDTEANLLRINDIITEVKRQINSLERQAAKARRYKEVFEKLKELETKVAAFQIQQYEVQLAQLNLALSKSLTRETEDSGLIEQLSQELNSRQQELFKLEENQNSLRAQLNACENEIAQNTQQLSFNCERTQELKGRLGAAAKQKEELLVKISQSQAKISSFKANLDTIIKELEDKRSCEHKSENELEEVTQEINLTQSKLKEAKARVLEFAACEASLNNQIHNFTSEFNQAIARKKRLDIERLKGDEELSVVRVNLEAASLAESAAYKKFIEQKDGCEQLKTLYNNSLKDKEGLSRQLQNLENERLALDSQKEFLSNLKLKYENISESSNAVLLLDSLSDEKISGIILKVEDIQRAQASDFGIFAQAGYRVRGVAKPISLDPQEIIDKIEKLKVEIAQSRDELNLKTKIIDEFSSQLSFSEKSLREKEIEYNNYKNQKDNIEQHFNKLKDEFGVISEEAKEAELQLNKLSEDEKALNESLVKIKQDTQGNQRLIEQGIEDIASKNSLREKTLLTITQLKAEICAYEEKVSAAEETCRMFEEAYSKDQAVLESILQEERDSKKRIQELEDSSGSLGRKIENSKKQKELLEKGADTVASFLNDARGGLISLQNNIAERKNTFDTNKSAIHELQMQQQELNFLHSGVCDRISQTYKINSDELKDFPRVEFNVDEGAQEIELLRQKLESYGQVNLVAIEEFEELKARFDFLNAQQADLINSKESLHEAILKINRTTKKMFLETFEKLAVEFKNYFRLLFGGGDAQLFLIDEQDVLESGIEIVCRPPGKKLQNVLLLSGGEKSMSAIALLFAIFKVKPSPFCVLDEIDAALDEANVDRFSRMLVDFTSQSQFIVITHNKKTIANANIMYGITMEKAGISKIVSVKLAENRNSKNEVSSSILPEQQDVLEPA